MPEKKRKRNSETPSKPAKKVAFQDPSNVKVVHVGYDESYVPVIATSPGISIPADIVFNGYENLNVPNSSRQTELLLHSQDHPRMNYMAREIPRSVTEGKLNSYLGIYDPEAREIKLLPAKRMIVRTSLRPEDPLEETTPGSIKESKGMSRLESRQRLGLEFGNKKLRKQIQTLQQNKATSAEPNDTTQTQGGQPQKHSKVTAAILEKVNASVADVPDKNTQKASIEAAKPRPTPNLEATEPSDVYPIKQIVGDEVLAHVKVKPWVEAVENGESISTPSQFVTNRIVGVLDDEDSGILKLKVAKYIMHLLQFKKLLRDGNMKAKASKLPKRDDIKEKLGVDDFVANSIIKKFAEGNQVSSWYKDYLISHIIAMSLIVDDFDSDIYDIQEDLDLAPSATSKYVRELGASLRSMTDKQREKQKLSQAQASVHRIARLKIPLDFPKAKKLPVRGR